MPFVSVHAASCAKFFKTRKRLTAGNMNLAWLWAIQRICNCAPCDGWPDPPIAVNFNDTEPLLAEHRTQ